MGGMNRNGYRERLIVGYSFVWYFSDFYFKVEFNGRVGGELIDKKVYLS